MPFCVSPQEMWNSEPYKFHKEWKVPLKICEVTSIDRDTLATVCQQNYLAYLLITLFSG